MSDQTDAPHGLTEAELSENEDEAIRLAVWPVEADRDPGLRMLHRAVMQVAARIKADAYAAGLAAGAATRDNGPALDVLDIPDLDRHLSPEGAYKRGYLAGWQQGTAASEKAARDLCAWDLEDCPVPGDVDVPDDYERGMNDAGLLVHAAIRAALDATPTSTESEATDE